MSNAHLHQLTQRQLIDAARESCESLLLKMATAVESASVIPEQLMRRLILVAVMRKAVDTTRAVALLSSDVSYYENMNVLVRCLIESVVNGAYLQSATDVEVKTYAMFDAIPVAKIMKYIDTVAPLEFAKHLSGKNLDAFGAHVDKVKQATGKGETDFGWTRLSLEARCVRIDKQVGVDAFVLLSRGMFPVGHPYVHGNYRSLERLIPFSSNGQRYDLRAEETLYMAVTAITSLAAFVNRTSAPGFDEDLEKIAGKIQMYAKGLLERVNQSMKAGAPL